MPEPQTNQFGDVAVDEPPLQPQANQFGDLPAEDVTSTIHYLGLAPGAAGVPSPGAGQPEPAEQPPPEYPTLWPWLAKLEQSNPARQVGSALSQASANVNHLVANTAHILDWGAQQFANWTGTERGGFFKQIEDYAREQQEIGEREAAELRGRREDLGSKALRVGTGFLANLPTAIAATTMTGNPMTGLGALGALENVDQGPKATIEGALEGAASGGLLTILGPAGRWVKVPLVTGLSYLNGLRQGMDPETAALNAGLMGGVTAVEPGRFPVSQTGQALKTGLAETVPASVRNLPERLKITPQLNPIEQASQQYLTEHGIETPLSMQTGSEAAQQLEASIRKSPGGGAFGRKLEESKEQLVRLGQEKELPRIHPEPVTEEEAGTAVGGKLAKGLEQTRQNLLQDIHGSPTTPESAGQSVIDQGKQAIQQLNQQANDAYDTAWQRAGDPRLTKQVPVARDSTGGLVMGDVNMPVDIRWLKDIARQELPNLELLPAATQAQKAAVSIYRAVLAAKNYVPAKWAENALSGFKEEAREAPSPEERSYSQGVAAGVIPRLQAGIDAAVAEAGPEALSGLRAGRAATAQKYGVSDVFRNFGRDINDLEPVQVFNRMTWGRDTGINQLRTISQIAPEAMPEVGRAFVENGGNWDQLGPETKRILFHGDQNLINDLDQYHADLARFGPLTKLEPVPLFERLTRPEARTINQLRAVAQQAPDEMPQLGRAFVQGLLEKATREGDLGKVQSTLNKWLDLDAQSKSIMFKDPALIRDLDNYFFSLKRMMANPNPSGSGFMMGLNQLKGRIMTGLGVTVGGVTGGLVGPKEATLGAGLGILGGAGLEIASNAWLARQLFNPKFIRLVTKGIDMQNRGNLAGSRLVAAQILRDFPPEEPPTGPGQGPGPPSGGGTPPNPPGAPAGSAEGAAPETLHSRINERNTFYHATSPQRLEGILDSGEIRPGTRGGVSVSRVPQIDPKAEAGVTLVIDANHPEMPKTTPVTEPGYRKTDAGMVRVSPTEWKETPGGPMNPRFEFENRTSNQSIPLSTVKRALIDRSALPEGYDVDGLVKTLADHGIPAEIKEGGREIQLDRVSSLQERLQTLGDEALDRVKKSGTFQGRTLPSLFPAEVTKDMATWGAARIATSGIDFAKWSKAMLDDAADISPEAAAKVRAMLPVLYDQSKKEYEHHVQTMGAGNIADLPRIMEYYRAGKEGKNWYNFVRPALQPLFGAQTDLFLKMLAATSPNTKVTQNVLNAVKAYRQFLLGEPFTGMPAHVDNLNRAVADVRMSGPKVGAFGPNLLGNLTPVTVDLWMARAILRRDTVTPLQSKLVDYMTSQAAKKVGLQPAEMQAAIWTGIKKLTGSRDTSAPPEVVINEYLDRNPDIRKLFEDSMEMSKEHFAGLQSQQAPAKPPRNQISGGETPSESPQAGGNLKDMAPSPVRFPVLPKNPRTVQE